MRGFEFAERFAERARNHLNLLRGNRERRREKNMIAAPAVHRALHRISDHAGFHGVFGDAIGDMRFRRKRLAGFAVADDLDSLEQSHAANVAYYRELRERLESCAQFAAGRFHSLE